ncbi:MAG: UDP-glucose dehydrogenase family protein [Candidatus Hodarchaeales archaeon]|jgi:UDPglucose 6-dehydrogenase
MKRSKRISIVGTGFIGLVSAACFAKKGYETYASSMSKENIDIINRGEPPFFEDGLEELLKEAVSSGKLKGVIGREEAILNSDVTFLCVGTPMRDDKSADLQFIEQSSRAIGEALAKKDSYHLIVDRSTIIPGTTRNTIIKNIEQSSGKRVGDDFGVCMNPEFLREGESIYDTLNPDRIVIGGYDERSGAELEALYREFFADRPEGCPPIVQMELETAEIVKYANNCYLAMKISFANEFANLCETVPNVDVYDIMKAMGMDFRINPKFLRAGVGWGGSCFPKDVNAMVQYYKKQGLTPRLLQATLEANAYQAQRIVEIANEELNGNLSGKRIAILGLTFKPYTDDMREAPSLYIIDYLLAENAVVIGYDPVATPFGTGTAVKSLGQRIEYAKTSKEALTGADCVLVATDWPEFSELTGTDFKVMNNPLVIDGRRRLASNMEGVKYRGIGLGANS